MKRYIGLTAILLLTMLGVMAQKPQQDTLINKNLTIEKEFQPVIQPAGKLLLSPTVLEEKPGKLSSGFLYLTHPLQLGNEIKPIAVKPLLDDSILIGQRGITAGLGNYWNSFGQLNLPVFHSRKFSADFFADHRGAFAEKQFSLTDAQLRIDGLLKNLKLNAGAEFNHSYFNFYGRSFDAAGNAIDAPVLAALPTAQNVSQGNGFIELGSSETDTLQFNLNGGYHILQAKNGLTEQMIAAKFSFSNLYKKQRYGFLFDVNHLNYSQIKILGFSTISPYTVLSLQPFFMIEKTNWFAKVGVKATFALGTGRSFYPMPDITATWKVIPDKLNVYGGITGDYKINSLGVIYNEMPYLAQGARVEDTYNPINTYLGIRINPLGTLLLDGTIGYKYITNQYFFMNADFTDDLSQKFYSNLFKPVYSGAQQLQASLKLKYNWKNTVNVDVHGSYNHYVLGSAVTQPYMIPVWQAGARVDVKVNRKLNVYANFDYRGEAFAHINTTDYKMAPIADLSIGANYKINQWFSTFLKVNNVLNQHYQQFYGYEVQGIHFILGGSISF